MMEFEVNCTVIVHGVQTVEGESDSVDLVTTGHFHQTEEGWLICYEESDTTGYSGSLTTLTCREGQVIMTRTGSTESQLIVEKGRRHQCTYDTGYGTMVLGVSGDSVACDLNDAGGDLHFAYSLDVNTVLVSENSVDLHIEPTV